MESGADVLPCFTARQLDPNIAGRMLIFIRLDFKELESDRDGCAIVGIQPFDGVQQIRKELMAALQHATK